MRSSRERVAYSFSTFAPGIGSQTALAAARALAEDPRFEHNPVVFFGPTGAGKTHLLYAIDAALRAYPTRNVLHFTAEAFVRRLVESIRDDKVREFRLLLCRADALLVDDLELTGTTLRRMRAEILRLLAEAADARVRVIVTSRVQRRFISRIEKRLRERFPNALTVSVE